MPTVTTVLASCAAGAPANCEDVTDPLGIVVVVFAVAGLVLLTVAAVAGTDPRRRRRPRPRR
ncbi:hypothetical protein [Curtobacterium flaccumfaciens]|uniref:hypothetical protein n=1 Tax=Curtobacterium flaccumfaciens TaxID=2035 RepID=UPI001ADAE3BC|nr:hypothetical protein [Curtobacterium flaccumfaciens]MBO9043302.1 hypothetical protein [Curtobacterium flaccumfaciens pv. flaccumfaciens]